MGVEWGEEREDLFYEAFQMCRHLSAGLFTAEAAPPDACAATFALLAEAAGEAQAVLSDPADPNETAAALRRRQMITVCCAAAAELHAFVRGPVAASVASGSGGQEQPGELVAFEIEPGGPERGAGLALANGLGAAGAAECSATGSISPLDVARTIGYALHNLPSLARTTDGFEPKWFAGDAADIRRAVTANAAWATAFAQTTAAVDALVGAGRGGGGGGGGGGDA